MDAMSSGAPLSSTYLALWFRQHDDCMVTIDNYNVIAFEAGFTGQKAKYTWMNRMKKLATLGFIDTKPGTSGDFHYVLLPNPHKIIERHKGKIAPQKYNALRQRLMDTGSQDRLN
jgi:hypothetical protein